VRPDLPTGTVTFLFTDVEGSTRLLHELGAKGYAEALAEHRRAIREACAAEGGVEVDTQGDAFFFAFPTAPGALAAATALSDALSSGPIQVRVGLHTGAPLLTEEGYVGGDVHRAARIAAAGHGGQVLVSASTASLVDSELTNLGEHRFKDLGAPERVFQLGSDEFPSLKSLYRTNLPVPATPFLGRERELREAVDLLAREDTRLVTLTGPGGAGKTRLMLQTAAEVSDVFPDGVVWIPLAPLQDESALAATFAQALEVRERPDLTVEDSIVAACSGKRALIVADNCEHVLGGAAALVRQLIEGCPTLVVLASSRERLRLRAERIYEVPPMVPEDGRGLFVERATAVDAGFRADEHVAAICDAVDELPLAIELASARVRSLSTAAILDRLTERLGLLISANRDVDERQRTLEATIAWSYDLLGDAERRALRALSVFAGGCTLAAAGVVAGADLELLESLLDKSLLRHRIDEARQDRYWMLETIREYALRELRSRREAHEAERRHTEYFVGLAGEVVTPVARPTTDEQRYRFISDRANFREAHSRALVAGDAASALRFVRCLGRVMNMTGSPPTDSYTTGVASLALPGGHAEDRAYALVRTASFADHSGLFDSARELLSEAEDLFRELEDPHGTADAIVWQSDVALRMGRFGKAVALGERLAAIAEDLDDRGIASDADEVLGLALLGRALVDGDREAAQRGYALMAAEMEYVVEYEPVLEQAVARANLALAQFALEEYSDSVATAQRALRDVVGLDAADVRLVAYPLFAVGLSSWGTGEFGLALTLLTASARLHREQGFVPEMWMSQLHERVQSEARAELEADDHDAAVRAGEALSRDEAIALVLSVSPPG
jgi:predicted ATPase